MGCLDNGLSTAQCQAINHVDAHINTQKEGWETKEKQTKKNNGFALDIFKMGSWNHMGSSANMII